MHRPSTPSWRGSRPASRRSDTAPMYGCGHSERVVGKAVAGRSDVAVLTKVGLRWDVDEGAFFFDTTHPSTGAPQRIMRNLRPERVKEEVERSRERLQRDFIEVVQCHWPDPSTPVEETMSALADLVDAGIIGAIELMDVPLLERAPLWQPEGFGWPATSRATRCSTATSSRPSFPGAARMVWAPSPIRPSDRACSPERSPRNAPLPKETVGPRIPSFRKRLAGPSRRQISRPRSSLGRMTARWPSWRFRGVCINRGSRRYWRGLEAPRRLSRTPELPISRCQNPKSTTSRICLWGWENSDAASVGVAVQDSGAVKQYGRAVDASLHIRC